jgi:hypothetical protein
LKTTAQHESSISILLNKDVPLAEMAGHFLTDDDPADCGGYHGFSIIRAELFREHSAHARRDWRVLEQEGALEKFATVQAAAKDKVAVE